MNHGSRRGAEAQGKGVEISTPPAFSFIPSFILPRFVSLRLRDCCGWHSRGTRRYLPLSISNGSPPFLVIRNM